MLFCWKMIGCVNSQGTLTPKKYSQECELNKIQSSLLSDAASLQLTANDSVLFHPSSLAIVQVQSCLSFPHFFCIAKAFSVNDRDRYLFDLQGFLVVEAALSPGQIATLNTVLDQVVEHQPNSSDVSAQSCLRFDHLLSWGQPYLDLIDLPTVTPYLTALLGSRFRLDHTYVHLIRYGLGPIGAELHGGGTPFDPCQYYLFRQGQLCNGLVAVAYYLTDVLPGEGGFGCIPGSHKSNLPLPDCWRDLTTPAACVQEIAAPAGTALIFTEALTHGTLLWQGDRDRRTLFYKYSPHPSAWYRHYYQPDDYPLTEAQRHILKPPGVSPP